MIIDTVFVLTVAMSYYGDFEANTRTFQTRHECREAKAEIYAAARRIYEGAKRQGINDMEEKMVVYVSDCEAVPVTEFKVQK